ncbi:MAG TPA: hypothetical protein VMV94_09860 [Phycisphaerae bacterium]|nr:hypothetical protein [Phycisphaerae bacterium]
MFQAHRRGIRGGLNTRTMHHLAAGLAAAGLVVLLSGCSAATRPDPAGAFDEITRRSLNEDGAYVRAHLSPSYLTAAKAPQADAQLNEFIRGLMAQLQLCRATSVEKTDDLNRVTIEAACVQNGSIQQCKFDLVYDKKTGWMLASPARDTKPLEKKTPKP